MIEKFNSLLPCKIRNMSFVCMLVVVAQHVPGCKWIYAGGGVISGMAVPFFFIVSGFFLAAHIAELHWWRDEMRKRIRSILIPYLIFLFSWYIARAMFGETLDFSCRSFFVALGGDLSQLPAVGALWYLRCLMIFMLCAFPISLIIKKSYLLAILFLVLLAITGVVAHNIAFSTTSARLSQFLRWGISLSGLFWFVLGITIRYYNKTLKYPHTLLLVSIAVVVFYLILAVCMEMKQCVTYSAIKFLMVASLIYIIWHIVPSKPFPVIFTENNFALYVMHWQFVSILGKFSSGSLLLLFTIGCCILIAISIRRIAPRFAAIIYGGR